ncbi:MAG: carbon storage regulator [Planctomycetota bacterium]|nr:MAG: carbon storage regulator [Planctomycetota bacterium]REJ96952.1 MAG: carbon storage regulator [Planctomycetota bacterium]REK26391.1 MAG: carbon storage regulator [Planctomycetota bacterium]REK37940.1 MAG: carbon storage regulator [Planctomycetota bacterium]
MLLLSRKKGERITIGDETTVVVTRIANNRVVIGIEAPPNVRIVRDEIGSGETDSTIALSPASEHCEPSGDSRGNRFLTRRARTAAARNRAKSQTVAKLDCEVVVATG